MAESIFQGLDDAQVRRVLKWQNIRWSDGVFVSRDAVIKRNVVGAKEVVIQRKLAEQGLAVPVWYYGPITGVPGLYEAVQGIWNLEGAEARLHYGTPFIVMARAQRVPRSVAAQALQGLEGPVNQAYAELRYPNKNWGEWEACARHVMRYKGRLVAIDFE